MSIWAMKKNLVTKLSLILAGEKIDRRAALKFSSASHIHCRDLPSLLGILKGMGMGEKKNPAIKRYLGYKEKSDHETLILIVEVF